ncbi:MAG: ribonucleotide-diphosphate reductase subunit alpha [Candidatus Accumulibacter phosphatis]|uniref:Ribonucleotide-diphosphate reductase subunit alpha n=1 Tax=Candidatus Accumulibacter phosphatis TaxID=327160 RepID=A0A080M7Y5_9PROT|nr:TIR domain-containing protein [Accumulibacter sp.]KFB73244.1 MAG: ribonucleotide-diphosphate reductase subunit alpha [Candidatus Accumulibacter phosphatis]HCZ17404.1 TIR domain-containing protein [Accumulibacter sp.]HRF11407.1 TIR domain-containing protein [Candidatus Accumulibacter phosphatis]
MSWVQPQPYDHRLFDQIDLGSPFGRLCLILAPALRIEPRLLRNARQRYLPRSDASLENRLWFSRVIETRSTRSVNLRPGLARRLVDQLAVQGGPHGRERLARICDFIAEQTRDWDPLDRIEQSLRWAVRDDDQARVGELLRELLRRIATSSEERSRADLARWIKGALPPLQAVTEAHRESGWLAQFAGAALGDTGIVLRGHGTPREPMPGWLATLLPASAGLTLGLRLGRSDERLILECLEPEPGLPRLDLFTPAPAPVHIECENRAQGSPGWVSLFVGCRIPVGRSCHALILQTLDGRRFRVASREGSEAIRADHSPSRSVVFVCASGDEKHAFRLADLLKRQGVSVRVEPLAASMRKMPDSAAAADPDEQLVVLWSRHAASAMENDPERVRNVFSPAASGAAYRLLIGLDRTPLPEGIGAGGAPAARLDFSERSADWGRDEAQAVLSALSSERPVVLQVLRSDHTLEEFRPARLAADVAEVLPATPGRQERASALAQQIEASLRRRRPRGGIVDTVEIGGEVERALVRAGEHEAARAYAERGLRGLSSDRGRDPAQTPSEPEREPLAEAKKTAGTDIYLSYARADQSLARELARRLADAGLRVFLDIASVRAGDNWHQKVEEARCVVILWSSAARKSDHVKAEAAWAVERSKYFPAVLDDFASLPPEFAQYYCADLRGWPRQKEAEAAFERFLMELRDSIAVLTTY